MTEYDKNIWQQALQYAFEELNRSGWDKKRNSKSYAIVNNGKQYPNKLVLQKAEEYLINNGYDAYVDAKSMSGGEPINNYLASKGAEVYSSKVKEKILTGNHNQEIIKKYKSIVQPDNSKEIYKWKLIQKFQGRPNLDVEDFTNEVTSINYQNLIYHNGIAVRNYLAVEAPEEYKKCYAHLFDERVDLHERVVAFQDNVRRIYKSLGNTLGSHHDERTIATLLCFKYPDKYPLYKNSFYSAYCKLLGIKQAAKNYRYEHYIELIEDFISNYIENDSELLSIKSNFLTEDCYSDASNLIFAQDILYQVLAYEEEPVKIEERDDANKIDGIEDLKVTNFLTAPLNQILYGPPGTGKTYNTINKAVAVANPSFNLKQDRAIVKAEYQRLVDAGQIVFTTFHQSMSYEDFVEGIKPIIEEDGDGNKQIVYEVQDGIFKSIVDSAKKIKIVNNENQEVYSFDDAWDELIEEIRKAIYEEMNDFSLEILTPNKSLKVKEITDKGNLRIKPESIDSLTYTVSYARTKKLHEAFPDLSVIKNIDKEFRSVIGGSNSTAYWAVLNNINKKINKRQSSKDISAVLPPVNHVLIIDEINRGNVSAIFGELITLIEDSKREGMDEALQVTLPYSKERFSIPSNLYIIGTMNTADRSVEALDTALRRRFVFEEMLPKPEILDQSIFGVKTSAILKRINQRLEKLIDRDHCIGHAYFIGKDESTIIDSFYRSIIPLLQEYFFGDYGKIGLVLGKGFIRLKKADCNVFAEFDYDYVDDLESKPIYEIIDYRTYQDEELTFDKAIRDLMR